MMLRAHARRLRGARACNQMLNHADSMPPPSATQNIRHTPEVSTIVLRQTPNICSAMNGIGSMYFRQKDDARFHRHAFHDAAMDTIRHAFDARRLLNSSPPQNDHVLFYHSSYRPLLALPRFDHPATPSSMPTPGLHVCRATMPRPA